MDEKGQPPQHSSQRNDQQATLASGLRFPVVGIGASAGGLAALMRFFEQMPADSGIAFVVVLHLLPGQESSAAEILQGISAMAVSQVERQTPIEADHVYVVPPSQQLWMNQDHLGLNPLNGHPGRHASIDLFFRTLADAHAERAIGIVLSGSGADGAAGLARIKESGGITLVQEPTQAEYDSMPRAAIATGQVDFVLSVEDMPAQLMAIWNNARSLSLPLPGNDDGDRDAAAGRAAPLEFSAASEDAFQDILVLLHKSTSHDFRHYKRATILRRIHRRLQICGLRDLPGYLDFMKSNPREGAALLQDLLIGVTSFFRDPEAFHALEQQVLPQLFDGAAPQERVRVWAASCSTGEEAYSLAMLLSEQAERRSAPADYQVFATDINEAAIASARAGLYPAAIEADISVGRLRRFFNREDRHYRIKKSIREKMLFAPHDLLKDSPFSKLDLITCRNLLIYLNRDVQLRLLELFHFALNPGGYLFLGTSETADAADALFSAVDKKNGIYRSRMITHQARNIPSLPMMPPPRPSLAQTGQPAAKPKLSFEKIHQRALMRFAAPSVVVDPDSNVLHISPEAAKYLRHISGEPSRNLAAIVLPELRLELRATLFQAIQSAASASSPRVRLQLQNLAVEVQIEAHPFHDAEANADFVLVAFNRYLHPAQEQDQAAAPGARDPILMQLEQELQRTKDQLQETLERSEAATEELKASNEELQTINEELRSATEELETSREELQSVNEELVTVNCELKTKVDEASKINDDLNNLIASSNIATVFVDAGMHIKRFTPAATDVFNIIPSDIGRSLLDITHQLDYARLADDAAATFETLLPIEREVRSRAGGHYLARILPYRTTDDRIGGAVLTFIDITSRHQAEEKVRESERRLQLFAESTRDYAIITSDHEGRIASWNRGAERIFGYPESEALGQSLDIIWLPEDIAAGLPAEQRRIARMHGRAEQERWQAGKDGRRIYCSGMLAPLRTNDFDGYASILRDVTANRDTPPGLAK
jgi:two-component system CheB/CheR fusion protein